jgi:phage portal protein BeeE
VELVPKFLQEMAGRLEVYPSHRINRAIDNPNPFMVRYHLTYSTFASQELTGRGYWWMFKDKETGKDQVWPIPTHWCEPVHIPGKLYAYYNITLPGMGEPIKVPTRQIIPFSHPDPSDPFASLSPLQANARAVMTDWSIDLSQRMSFENGINPGLAIMVGKPPEFAGVGGDQMVLTKEQRDQIIGAVRRQWRGVSRFEEPLILDALIKDVKPITTTPKEMAYRESSKLARDKLAHGFSMNPITLERMVGRINETRFKMEAYAEYLGDKKAEIEASLTEARAVLRAKIAEMGRTVAVAEPAAPIAPKTAYAEVVRRQEEFEPNQPASAVPGLVGPLELAARRGQTQRHRPGLGDRVDRLKVVDVARPVLPLVDGRPQHRVVAQRGRHVIPYLG